MQHIETIKLTSSQSSITFSSIPQDYDDLVILISARNSAGNNFNNMRVSFNSATSGYSEILLQGSGSSASSGSGSTTYLEFQYSNGISTSNTFGNTSMYISNYTASRAKSISTDGVSENNATATIQFLTAQLWNDTSAITSITVDGQANSGSFVANSTFSLYGVTAGGDGTVTTS